MLEDYVDPLDYHNLMKKLREFFIEKENFVECYVANRLSILAACEQPENVAIFNYLDQDWAHFQTSQMWLESIILKDDQKRSYCCLTTSYRDEKNPIPNRHSKCFPLFEFEFVGNMNDLIQKEKDLLEFLGFGDQSTFVEIDYAVACQRYGVSSISHIEEAKLCDDFGPVVFLKYFPHNESFWNMKVENGIAFKTDVIIMGHETIGSAERSINVDEMRERFHTTSNGEYAQMLYDKFGKERVDKELEEYLQLTFTTRCGAGLGMTRILRALKQKNLH